MGELLANPLRFGRNSRKAGRALLASLLVLELAGACSPGKGDPAPHISSAGPTAVSPEPVPTLLSPSPFPSWTASLPPVQVKCQAERTSEWTRVPPSLDVNAIARRLGVDADVVRQGTLVWADCSGAIWTEDLTEGVMADVHGIPPEWAIDPRCLMDVSSNIQPSYGIAVRHVGGVCLPLPGAASGDP